ncbi:MAG: hypothetical protein Q9170_000325 [Blastenia crenularia]
MFFALSASSSKKTARGKKGRPSKNSRISTQSNVTAASEDISMIDVNVNEDNAIIRQTTDPSKISRPIKGAKRAVKGKKPAPRPEQKTSAILQEDTIAGSSFVEPEDDNFEVKVEQSTQQNTSKKKRKSDEMSIDDGLAQAEVQIDGPPPHQPSPKRRAIRSSMLRGNKTDELIAAMTQVGGSHLTHVEDIPSLLLPNTKATKSGGERASTSARKVSTTSTASKASLRATLPDEEEINAVLEADLDRPLTDDEAVDAEPTLGWRAKARRLTKTRPASRNVTASIAPVRRATRASALLSDGESITMHDAPRYDEQEQNLEESKAVGIALSAIDYAEKDMIAETNKHTASKAKARGRPSLSSAARKKGTKPERDNQGIVRLDANPQEHRIINETVRKPTTARTLNQSSEGTYQTSEASVENIKIDNAPKLAESINAPTDVHEDATNGTHGIRGNKTRIKEVKPRNALAKKGKSSKKEAAAVQLSEDGFHLPMEGADRDNQSNQSVTVDIHMPNDEGRKESPLPEAPKNEGKTTNEGYEKATEREAASNMEPSQALSTEAEQPVGVLPVIMDNHQVVAGIATPADSQSLDGGRKTPERPPSSRTPAPSAHETPKRLFSPQSSDAENQPPSARPLALRPPVVNLTPSKTQVAPIAVIATTPIASPSTRNIHRLQTTLPWDSINFDRVFTSPLAEKESTLEWRTKSVEQGLPSPEKKLTVEEWIRWNARRGEEKLREDCEKLVGKFESEGVRALKALEGIVCKE